MTREERLTQIKREREERKARETRLQEIKASRAAAKEETGVVSSLPSIQKGTDREHLEVNLADTAEQKPRGFSGTRQDNAPGFTGMKSDAEVLDSLRGSLVEANREKNLAFFTGQDYAGKKERYEALLAQVAELDSKVKAQEPATEEGGFLSDYFKDIKFLPDSWEGLGRGLAYNAERAAAGALGFGEGITDMLGTAFYKGVEGLASGFGLAPNAVSKWAGEAAEGFLNNSVTDRYNESIRLRYNPTVGEEKWGGLTQGTADVLASLATGKVAANAIKGGAQIMDDAAKAAREANIVKGGFGLSASGRGAKEAYDEGATTGQALTYGAASGMAEVLIESLAGGIPGMGDGKLSQIVKKVVDNPVVNGLLDVLGEGGEEALSAVISPFLKRAVYDADAEMASWEEIGESAVLGALTSLGLQGLSVPGAVSSVVSRAKADAEYRRQLTDAIRSAAAQQNTNEVDTTPAAAEQNVNEPTRLTNSQVERMIRDEATMQEMGIDTNGKTMSQLRTEVRARMAAQEQGAVERSAETDVQTPAEETASTANPAASEAETRSRMNMGEVATAVLGENGAKAFRSTYNSDMASRVDAESAATGFNTVYKAALDGRTMTAEEQTQTASLPSELKLAAESSARMDRQRASQAKYFGENAMLVKDDNFKKMHLSSKTVRTLDAVAKVAGVQVRFVEQVKEGRANAAYGSGVIEVAMDSNDPVMTAFTHEIVHRIRETSPQSYAAMAEFVQKYLSENTGKALADRYKKTYNTTDVSFYTEEMVADAFGTILQDSKAMEQFVKDDRSTAQKVLDAVRDLINAVKRALNHQNVELNRDQKTAFMALQNKLTEMEGALVKALESVPKSAEKNTATMGGEVKHSYKGVNKDGIEVYETSKDTLKLSWKERKAKYLDFMKNKYAGRTAKFIRNGHAYYAVFDRDSLRKPIYGDDRASRKGRDALVNAGADGDVFDLVERSSYSGSGKNTKTNTNADYFDYFVKTVQIDNEVFDLVADVEKHYGEAGGYVYTLALVDNKTKKASPAHGTPEMGPVKTQGNASSNIVAQTPNAVNPEGEEKSSLKTTDGDFSEAAKAAIKDAQLARMGKEYGFIPPGENPARVIELPRRTADDNKVSQTVRTILEAEATPDELVPNIEKLVADGDLSYSPISDEAAVAAANAIIERVGWDQAQRDWFSDMKKGVVSKDNTTMGWVLYNNAANEGNTKLALDILNAMVKSQRSAAQALQATRILKTLSPETQLYAAQKSVEGLTEELKKRYGDDIPGLTINPAMAEKFLNARTDKGRAEAMVEIYRDIGRQMPSRFMDKFNAWRYLAMLGNPRTHVRNIVGNAGFAPVVAAKNLTATAIERVVLRNSDSRTKSVALATKEGRSLLKAAWADYANVTESMPDGKYSDHKNANRYIEEGRVIFGRGEGKTSFGRTLSNTAGKLTEKVRRFNSGALAYEDMWFAKPHYASALAQYCKAHGITVEELQKGTSKRVGVARNYAMREAQKATYQDSNEFSEFFSRMGRNPSNKKTAKAMNALVEGVLPFRKTPANILVRSVEYSPLGLVRGLKNAILDVRKGNVTASEAIDRISSGLTGTALLGLGVWLAAEGLVRGHGDDEKEKEKDFTGLQGHQGYALELPDGTSITLDWLAPEALPFFIGVNLWEMTSGMHDAPKMGDILGAVSNVSEPLLEMSCLQGLNDLLDSVGYASSEGLASLPQVLISSATSLLTQMVPTLLGQIERTGETARMTTYTDKNIRWLTPDMQYFIGKVSARLPGFDYNQIPYIDAWGREEASGGLFERAFNNFLNPAYMSEVRTSAMEQELERLYASVGETELLPSRAPKSFTVEGADIDLTAEQYVEYATFRGQRSYDLLTELTESRRYSGLDDKLKASAVKKCYSVANEEAKALVSEFSLGKFHQSMDKAEAAGISGSDYILFYVAVSELKQDQVRAWLNRSGYTNRQKQVLWSTKYSSSF